MKEQNAKTEGFDVHFLQSRIWEEYQKLEGHETFYFTGEGFVASGVITKTKLGDYLYLAYGPAVKDVKAFRRALGEILKFARERRAIFVRIEPTIVLSKEQISEATKSFGNFSVQKTHDLDPANTWVLDLSGDLEQILGGIEKSKTKRWRNYAKHGIKIRQTKDPDDIPDFVELLQEVAERRNYIAQEEGHLKNQLRSGFATLYLAELEGEEKPIAGDLVFDGDGTRYALHAAASSKYSSLRAGVILKIETIVDAKKNGQEKYDFWGMTTSNDPKHPWYGFTQYKKTFGGYQVDYAGTYDIVINPVKYKAYVGLRKINRARRLAMRKVLGRKEAKR
ncbi:MAG: peptidoglycan bridge formation glycyltransferase FemA/FemB family protein [Candidatus Saccharibacteria bacterium]|nr:peptidoglycan bridge formation glycyltransferase FemA/FemB family protein [Candidatus Saccharibacteria bacterium]